MGAEMRPDYTDLSHSPFLVLMACLTVNTGKYVAPQIPCFFMQTCSGCRCHSAGANAREVRPCLSVEHCLFLAGSLCRPTCIKCPGRVDCAERKERLQERLCER